MKKGFDNLGDLVANPKHVSHDKAKTMNKNSFVIRYLLIDMHKLTNIHK